MLLVSLALAGSVTQTLAEPRYAPACDLAQQILQTDASDDAVLGALRAVSHCEHLGLPVDGTFQVFQALQGLLLDDLREPRADLSPVDRVDRSLVIAETAQRVDRTNLVGTMAMLANELTAQGIVEAALADLPSETRDEVRRRARGLLHGPTPDLHDDLEEVALVLARGEVRWNMALWSPWCIAERERATTELRAILNGPEDRRAALVAWTAANPEDGWMPWTRAGEQCRHGLDIVLVDWIDDRRRADAGWQLLAR